MGALPGNTDANIPAMTAYEAVPGLVYLRRPGAYPAVTGPPGPEENRTGVAVEPEKARGLPTSAVAGRVGMLVGVWLEVLDGRRPVSALRKGPFSPRVAEDLRGRLRESHTGAGSAASPAASRVLSVHLPPTHRQRLTFTASVAHRDRVRAVAGHLARYDGRWRIESVSMI